MSKLLIATIAVSGLVSASAQGDCSTTACATGLTCHSSNVCVSTSAIVGSGATCGGSVPMEYQKYCSGNLSCHYESSLPGAFGTCRSSTNISGMGGACGSGQYCTSGLYCSTTGTCTTVGNGVIAGTCSNRCWSPRVGRTTITGTTPVYETRTQSQRVYLGRVNASGQIIDNNGNIISTAGSTQLTESQARALGLTIYAGQSYYQTQSGDTYLDVGNNGSTVGGRRLLQNQQTVYQGSVPTGTTEITREEYEYYSSLCKCDNQCERLGDCCADFQPTCNPVQEVQIIPSTRVVVRNIPNLIETIQYQDVVSIVEEIIYQENRVEQIVYENIQNPREVINYVVRDLPYTTIVDHPVEQVITEEVVRVVVQQQTIIEDAPYYTEIENIIYQDMPYTVTQVIDNVVDQVVVRNEQVIQVQPVEVRETEYRTVVEQNIIPFEQINEIRQEIQTIQVVENRVVNRVARTEDVPEYRTIEVTEVLYRDVPYNVVRQNFVDQPVITDTIVESVQYRDSPYTTIKEVTVINPLPYTTRTEQIVDVINYETVIREVQQDEYRTVEQYRDLPVEIIQVQQKHVYTPVITRQERYTQQDIPITTIREEVQYIEVDVPQTRIIEVIEQVDEYYTTYETVIREVIREVERATYVDVGLVDNGASGTIINGNTRCVNASGQTVACPNSSSTGTTRCVNQAGQTIACPSTVNSGSRVVVSGGTTTSGTTRCVNQAGETIACPSTTTTGTTRCVNQAGETIACPNSVGSRVYYEEETTAGVSN